MQESSGDHVPEVDDPVLTAAGEDLAVGTEGYPADRLRMDCGQGHDIVGVGIGQPDAGTVPNRQAGAVR